MARYTCSFAVAISLEELQSSLGELLRGCHFDVIYNTGDYLMARETPGEVSFAKLVTVEALIDRTKATADNVQVNLVIKNEELPLQVDNHCRLVSDRVQNAISAHERWQLLERVAT
ncbi:hypothetical protein KR51_00022500 [Rubidibacter lacunae KORDI 51-2]|uniref:Uncharacterized protein n=2 Tax=Rubidibacter TaxID=582491 RepID=U5DJV7_9CHRO|nr:hypothetical protein KR51_00022500 [Rubidibacter lacunae KORDI 51-2]